MSKTPIEQQQEQINNLNQLTANLNQIVGSIQMLKERERITREEICTVNGKLEILNKIVTSEKKEEN